ncbi:hypothetical protein GGI11_005430 [Coemansia sp. RSA 2049]|nr:hypothetical protein GGI11_005430 [Coemansia sp. RSA 2049]
MYDYVRRQQELQPNMFTSTKTFQWMDPSVREPSWAKRCSKTGPMDPLAYSSSSLFTAAQRSSLRPGGTLGVFHRSAVSLTPHRALLAFRRNRQNSDAAVRPPSGVSSSFQSRRRGFTAPPGAQPPPASPLFCAASSAAVSASAAAPTSHSSRLCPEKTACVPADHGFADAPIKTLASPRSRTYTVVVPPPQTPTTTVKPFLATRSISSISSAAAGPVQSPRSDSRGCEGQQIKQSRISVDGHSEKTGTGFRDASSAFPPSAQHISHPRFFSSFSPPSSPQPPTRTICHRARQLMNKVRPTRTAGPPTTRALHTSARRHKQPQQFPEIHVPRANHGHTHRISSVLCVSSKNAAASDSEDEGDKGQNRGLGSSGAQEPAAQTAEADAGHRMQPQRSPPHALPGGKQPRVLPRSPLANPAILPSADNADDLSGGSGSETEPTDCVDASPSSEPNGAHAKPATAESSSSDDDGMSCSVCSRYRGLEWIVACESGHKLCFGCVQAHVKKLLASVDAFRVPCPLGGCDAHIPGKYLRDCLPPQRMQQLEANRKRRSRPVRAVTRYFSLDGRKAAAGCGFGGSTNASDEGFDAPVVVVNTSVSTDHQPYAPVTPQGTANIGVIDSDSLEESMARVSVGNPQRYSASMPVLNSDRAHPTIPESPANLTPMIMSELTKVSTDKGSIDSVVLAASVAADSGLSLSPESVGSRLRRVAKAQGNLYVEAAPAEGLEAVGGEYHEFSSPSLGQPVFLHPPPIHDNADQLQQPAQPGPVYDYSAVDFEMYMQTPPRRPHAMSFASSSSPISWQTPPPNACNVDRLAVLSSLYPKQQPEAPPSLPLQFRASATWITPEQRHSGYAENILLSATLFETIRRRSPPSDGDESDDGHIGAQLRIPRLRTGHYHPASDIPESPSAALADDDDDDDDAAGVYIPTWRRPETARREYAVSPWDDDTQYGSQSGILCEAAELTFDLYETLHKRR